MAPPRAGPEYGYNAAGDCEFLDSPTRDHVVFCQGFASPLHFSQHIFFLLPVASCQGHKHSQNLVWQCVLHQGEHTVERDTVRRYRKSGGVVYRRDF